MPMYQGLLEHISELNELKIIRLQGSQKDEKTTLLTWDAPLEIGFPPPQELNHRKDGENRQELRQAGSLCGSTKTAAKRRLAALKKILKAEAGKNQGFQEAVDRSAEGHDAMNKTAATDDGKTTSGHALKKEWNFELHEASGEVAEDVEQELCREAKTAIESLEKTFHFTQRPKKFHEAKGITKNAMPEYILPKQVSYAGSHAAQNSVYGELTLEAKAKIPDVVMAAFGLGCGEGTDMNLNGSQRKLYVHQAKAISSAVQDCHTLVCTTTGSGKSLVCFRKSSFSTCAFNGGMMLTFISCSAF